MLEPFRKAQLTVDQISMVNPLTPNDDYSGRTTPLTSKRFILYTGCAKIKKVIPAPKG